MDVHRARFVSYPTPSINATAFSRPTDGEGPQPNLKLAIGRANGSIEIWSSLSAGWVQESVFGNSEKRSIDGLLWTQEPDERDAEGNLILGQHRLFSTSCSPMVTEWNMAEGHPKKQSSGNFSDVWCFAAQPRRARDAKTGNHSSSQEIVAGCSNGELVLLSTADDDVQFKRVLARASKKTSCLSITYQNAQRVVAGFVDGAVRVYDTQRLTCLRSMSLGASLPGAMKNIHVWQVRCLRNGDIASGDSNGNVTIFDGKSYNPYSTIAAHETDCLDLVASADGNTIFSGSMEGRISVLRKAPGLAGRNMWTKQSHRKHHDGDIKCLAAFDGDEMSLVVSGGDDVKAVMTPLREHGRAPGLILPHLPQRPRVVSARQARLLVSWWDKTISIWRVARSPGLEPDPRPPRKLVAKMKLATEHDITAMSISDDGRVLAVSTRSETKFFRLRQRPLDDALAIRKVELPLSIASTTSRVMSFSPDGKWLAIITSDNDLKLLRLTVDAANPKKMQILDRVVEFERPYRPFVEQTAFTQYDRTVVQMSFASDSSMLAVGDMSGYIDTWILEGHEDPTAPAVNVMKKDTKANPNDDESDSDSSDDADDDDVIAFYGQRWAENPRGHLLPKLECMPLVLSFRPQSKSSRAKALVNGSATVHDTLQHPQAPPNERTAEQYKLFVLTARHQIHEFDVLSGRTSDWSRRNPTAFLPADFSRLQDRAMGAVWDVTETRERLWMYGSSWLFMLDVGVDHGREEQADDEHKQLEKRKRKSGPSSAEGSDAKSKRRRLGEAQGRGLAGTIKRRHGDVVTEIELDQTLAGSGSALGDDDENMMQLARVDDGADEQRVAIVQNTRHERKHWCTTKYRSILGMVPLDDIAATDFDRPPEVVIVERPIELAERRP